MLAVPSFDVVSVGAGMSSALAADDEPDRDQDRRRWVAAGVILLLGLAVSMVLLHVERLARANATRLLEELGDGKSAPRPSPIGRGLWAFVLLVFVLMAVLALSKRWF
jgi:energy-coupling factor transporter transmembrane protein EcfT